MLRTERQIEINAPIKRVFDLFSDLERCPQWMGNIRSVFRVGDNLTQWIATTQGGGSLNWVAEIVDYNPHQVIAWRSVGGDVDVEAQAKFTESSQQTTLLHVLVGYDLRSDLPRKRGSLRRRLGKIRSVS
ncbi:MAG: SRPBCC family protein [Pyrinomonadaceae bacterium]